MAADELGVTERSTKAELWGKIQELTKGKTSAERKLERMERKAQQENADRVQAITDRIRAAKPRTQDGQLHNVIVSATHKELEELHEFFSDYTDLADHFPLAVQRLIVGVAVLLGHEIDEQEEDA